MRKNIPLRLNPGNPQFHNPRAEVAPPRASPLQPGDDFSSFPPTKARNLLLTKLEKSDKEARESHQHLRPTFDADDGQGAYAQLQHHPYPYTEYVFKLQFRQNGGTATRRIVDEAKQLFFLSCLARSQGDSPPSYGVNYYSSFLSLPLLPQDFLLSHLLFPGFLNYPNFSLPPQARNPLLVGPREGE